jgi:hypothetical protein
MAMLAMLWVDHLVQLSSLIFWLSERYQDVESVPEQLKAVHGYYSDLVQYLLTLQRICLPDGTQTLHSDDVQTVRSISERCTQQIHDAANIIGSCIDSYPKVPSFWDSFSGIFIPPEWIKKKDTIGQILQNVKGSMEIISSITGANTHQKVCDMQKQMENMERMISTGLANQNLNRRHRSSSNAQPNGWAFLGNKRKKRHSQTSSALPTQEADPRTELHAKLADLVAGRDEYLWYG